jgi:hypothetical protein
MTGVMPAADAITHGRCGLGPRRVDQADQADQAQVALQRFPVRPVPGGCA